jgi:hypothetical protein
MKPQKVIVEKERIVHTYSELWHASDCVLNSGIEEPKGSSWQFLSSALLSAFTFEAYLNHVGERTIKCWEDLDRLPPMSKFNLICETLGVQFTDGLGARPLQTVEKLFNFRNTIAHGRSLKLEPQPIHRDNNDKVDHYLGEKLLTEWETLIKTKDFALRVREDVKSVLERLHEARKDPKEVLFSFGHGTHQATLAGP